MRSIIAILLLSLSAHAQTYDVTRFGAVGDSTTDNTAALQRAIDSCAKRGGKLYFPAGTYLTATLYLRSHVTLHLLPGATILASPDITRYPYLDAGIRFYGEEWARQSLIFCKDQTDVGIEGEGTIDGQGARFVTTTIKKPDRYRNRPYLLWFAGSRNITIKGIHLRNSAFWMEHYLGCENVLIDGVKIWNHSNKNNDMMDIDGCRYVTISNVTGDSDDDGLTIKSTSPRISEYITITNCILSSHCNALKFGTESTGGFRNIVISNCIIKPSAQRTVIYGSPDGMGGIALEIADGGIMENVNINNVIVEGAQVPLFLRLGNRARKYIGEASTPSPGRIRNIHFSNITATGADETGCSITGIPGAPIEDISLSNIRLETTGSDSVIDVLRPVDEKETLYPEGNMFGLLPAYGLYIRHARNIRLSGITIRSRKKDSRPGIVAAETEHFDFTGLDIATAPHTPAALYFIDSKDGSAAVPARTFYGKDKRSKNITISHPYPGKP
ncbi:MAG: polygalacturonase [Chitinophagaceae bacterium]|nr:polygalacturonase [Chitinophagaceae bacterium]